MNRKSILRIFKSYGMLIALAVVTATAFGNDISTATFYRGFNLNGPAIEIDGNRWEGRETKSLRIKGSAFENQSVPLNPATDRNRAAMIRSSNWGGELDITLDGLTSGSYQLVVYVWEDNQRTEFQISLNDMQMIERHSSGTAGCWQKLGPWLVDVEPSGTKQKIKLSARGGAANVSGIELWRGRGPLPSPPPIDFNLQPTPDQLAFFESRIRPILTNRCYDCHGVGSDQIGGGLLLDSQAGILAGGTKGRPVIPSEPEGSLLIRAVQHRDQELKMPPDESLEPHEIDDLISWIAQGAPDPRNTDTVEELRRVREEMLAKAAEFWSLRPMTRPVIPQFDVPNDDDWAHWRNNEIDHFVLRAMRDNGLHPSPPADRATLIRRASFDLIGLPPTPHEIDAFTNDPNPDAYHRLIDRLLQSPGYGQRWGRHWLDVVRYADTAGDNSDFPIPQMSKYRDWVIDAIGKDLSYDQFVTYQLAGDLLPSSDRQESLRRLTATGYIANARRFGSRVNDYPQHLTIEDTIDNLGRAFLGTTLNCARCHDHKFDPITAEDYYALYGIFNSTRYPWPGIELDKVQRRLVAVATDEEVASFQISRQANKQEIDARVKALNDEIKSLEGDEEQQDSLKKKLVEAKTELDTLEKTPPPYEQLYAVAEAERMDDARVQIKGDPSKPGKLVPRRFLSVLGGSSMLPEDIGSGRQSLARWITDAENPLTYRVIVNRVWQGHFGSGLVATPNDFGRQGIPPTHPELLDFLASEFVRDGMSLKALHRKIMHSATYQQSSDRRAIDIEADPANHYLSAFPKRRLEAEAIRDALLFLSGKLDLGPSPPHPFPAFEKWSFTQHNPFKAVYPSNHRSVYLMTQRIQRHPFLAIFDGADPATSTSRRQTSTTPLQSLYLLNDALVHDCAAALASKAKEKHSSPAHRLNFIFRSALGRPSRLDERRAAFQFLKEYSQANESESDPQMDAWSGLVRVIFRLNEFVYVD